MSSALGAAGCDALLCGGEVGRWHWRALEWGERKGRGTARDVYIVVSSVANGVT